MHFFRQFHNELLNTIKSLQDKKDLPASLNLDRVTVEPPREESHGDLSTNAAMVLSKEAGLPPRKLAELLAAELEKNSDVTCVDIAGPGFINISLKTSAWLRTLKNLLTEGSLYGNGTFGKGKSANVEYVSVNPTGPMHAGHGRVAVVGDALAALLEKVGFSVTREYYINDAGGQADTLAQSVYLRYREALGKGAAEIPAGLYPGAYLIPVAEALAKEHGPLYLDMPESEWLVPIRTFSIAAMMRLIKADLSLAGIHQEVFTSELKLVEDGAVERMIDTLKARGLIYTGVLEAPKGKVIEDWEARPQLLFKATEFGDDTDRPLQKSDGSWTYFAKDIAYHYDKYQRTKGPLYNIWGADHGGYIKRIKAAVEAVTEQKGLLSVMICQMVNLMENGQPLKMSKRAGTFITLEEVIEKVGKDAFRLMMLMRKSDAPLDFDLSKAIEQSSDNPVFYIQYAHARIHSVMRQAHVAFPDLNLSTEALSATDLSFLEGPEFLSIIRYLAAWPRHIELAAEALEPHRIGFYLHDLAARFHALWNKGKENTELRFIDATDVKRTQAHLALLSAIALVLSTGLEIFGVKALKEMR